MHAWPLCKSSTFQKWFPRVKSSDGVLVHVIGACKSWEPLLKQIFFFCFKSEDRKWYFISVMQMELTLYLSTFGLGVSPSYPLPLPSSLILWTLRYLPCASTLLICAVKFIRFGRSCCFSSVTWPFNFNAVIDCLHSPQFTMTMDYYFYPSIQVQLLWEK